MADETPPTGQEAPAQGETLEMRLAAIEDKLAQVSVSEDEMKTYQKVSGVLASRGATMAPAAGASVTALTPTFCVISNCIIHACIIHNCIIWHCTCICPCQCVCQCQCLPAVSTATSPMVGFSRLGM